MTVYPEPVVEDQAFSLCSEESFVFNPTHNPPTTIVPLGTTYSWTFVDNPNITGATNGSGESQFQQNNLINTTNVDQTITYTISATSGVCSSTFEMELTVQPRPFVPYDSGLTDTRCSGEPFIIEPVNGVPDSNTIVPANTTYTWQVIPNPNISGWSDNNTPTNSISQELQNLTKINQSIEYIITPYNGSCAGDPFSAIVWIEPKPYIPDHIATVCDGESFLFTPVNGVFPDTSTIVPDLTLYSWTVNDLSGGAISGYSSGSDQPFLDTGILFNDSSTVQTLIYTVTPTYYVTSNPASSQCEGDSFTLTVSVNPGVVDNAVVSNINCSYSELCGGSIELNPSGVGPYSFAWSYSGTEPDPIVDATLQNQYDLCPGDYTVEITDDLGCTYTFDYIIEPPEPVTFDLVSLVNVSSNNISPNCDGYIELELQGGTLPYSLLEWYTESVPDSGNFDTIVGTGSSIINNACEGNYIFKVLDADGCEFISPIYQIEKLINPITIDSQITNYNGYEVSCTDGNDGGIEVLVVGGSGSFAYSLNPGGILDADPVTPFLLEFENLMPGTYTLTISDNNGPYDVTVDYVLEAPTPITSSHTQISGQALCYGDQVTYNITASGGVPPYQGTGNHTLSAGTHEIQIMDANGCSTSEFITVIAPEELIASATITEPIPCRGDSGTVSIAAIGGTPPYTGVGDVGVTSGEHFFTVTDANGCSYSGSIIVDEPEEITFTVDTIVNPTCTPEILNDGSICITISGGTNPFPIGSGWTDMGNGSWCLNNLESGIYSIDVTDQNNCESIDGPTEIMLIGPPLIDEPAIQSDGVIDVSCNAAMDGSITLSEVDIIFPPDGPDPSTAEYRWINLDDPDYFGNTRSISNLGPGRYQLELVYNFCSVFSDYIIVTEPEPFAMDLQASCNGTLETGVAGGSGSYEYTLVHPNGRVEQLIASAGHVFPNLIPGGSYGLTVDDMGDRSCPPISGEITIPLGLQLNQETIRTQAVSCYGGSDGAIFMDVGDLTIQGGVAPFQIEWVSPSGGTFISDNPMNLEAGTYILNVTDQYGCSATTSVTVGSAQYLEITQSQVINQELLCSGDEDGYIGILISADPDRSYQIDWYKNNTSYATNVRELYDLGAGTYRVELRYLDDFEDICSISQEFIITEPDPIDAQIVNVQNVGCDSSLGGTVTVAVFGGTLPYKARVDGGAYQTFNTNEFTLTGIAAGSRQVTVTDANNCTPFTLDVEMLENEPILVMYSPVTGQVPINCEVPGSLSVEVSGGRAPYFYEWTGPSYSKSGIDLSTIEGLVNPGTYTLTVTDSDSCESEEVTMVLEEGNQGFAFEAIVQNTSCVTPSDPAVIELFLGTEVVVPYFVTWEVWGLLDPSNSDCSSDCYGWVRLPEEDGALVYDDALPGNYRITITDGSTGGCNIQQRFVAVPDGTIQIVDTELTSPTCNVADGQLYFGVEHINPIQLYLDGNAIDTSNPLLSYDTVNDRYSLNGLSPGTYSLEARDMTSPSGSCSAVYSFTVIDHNPITYTGETSFTIDVCENSPTFSLPPTTISGGTPFYGAGGQTSYDLRWIGPDNFDLGGVSTIPVQEGEYQLYITDAAGCTSEPFVFSFTNVYEPIRVSSNVIHPGCGNSTTGSINIEIEGGKPIYEIIWEREVTGDDGDVSYEEMARGYRAINNLEAGRYRLTVLSDLLDCTNDNPVKRYQETFVLGGEENLMIVEGPTFDAVLCDGQPGWASIQILDSTGAEEGDMTFYYNGNLIVSGYKGNGLYELFIDQPLDIATLSMANSLGCEITEEVALGVPDAVLGFDSANFGNSGTLLEQEEITFTNQTVGDFAWAVWNFGDGTEVMVDPATDPAEVIHSYEFSGTYEVSLEVFNAAGCSRRYSESLAVGLGYQILFPNAFTPNGDGINEYFEGEFTGIESFELRIYNVWGGLVTAMAYDYQTKPKYWGWDGNYVDGSPYVQKYFRYVFTAKTLQGEEVTRAGEAVILR
ncbi:PKD-like domain-containing protein [Flagellimonas marinaquae]|uniref:PKD-like domain-containing protein n=1 Tax=Flagellimonas marinaquae TaxID=254955 RepID=UPI003AAB5870